MSFAATCSPSCQLVKGQHVARPVSAQAPRHCFGSAPVTHQLRSASLYGRQFVASAPVSSRSTSGVFRVQANVATDVFKYLSEAASSIFSPMNNSTVNWEGTGSAFTGEITHHEQLAKLRKLHQTVVSAREQLAGCTDPNAANYNPNAKVDDGACEYVFTDSAGKQVAYQGDIQGFVNSALSGVVDGNFSKSSGFDWKDTTFNYSGDIVSQRDITRLLEFEKVVKKTLDKAEATAPAEAKK